MSSFSLAGLCDFALHLPSWTLTWGQNWKEEFCLPSSQSTERQFLLQSCPRALVGNVSPAAKSLGDACHLPASLAGLLLWSYHGAAGPLKDAADLTGALNLPLCTLCPSCLGPRRPRNETRIWSSEILDSKITLFWAMPSDNLCLLVWCNDLVNYGFQSVIMDSWQHCLPVVLVGCTD